MALKKSVGDLDREEKEKKEFKVRQASSRSKAVLSVLFKEVILGGRLKNDDTARGN